MNERRLFLSCGLTYFMALDEIYPAQSNLQHILNQLDPGATLLLESKRYIIDRPLEITKPINIVGNGSVLVNHSKATPTMCVLASSVFLNKINIIGAGDFTNKKHEMVHSDAIKIGNRNTVLENIEIRNSNFSNIGDTCIAVEGNTDKGYSGTNNIVIEKCLMTGTAVRNNYHAGIYIRNARNILISNCGISEFGQGILTTGRTAKCIIKSNTINETSKQHAVYLSGATEHAIVRDNRFFDLKGTGVKCSAPHTIISGNRIHKPNVWGINLKADLDSVEVSDNVITESGDDAIDSGFERGDRRQSNISILRNVIYRPSGNGINFAHDEDNCEYYNIQIENNQFFNCTLSGIRITNNRVSKPVTSNVTISQNVIKDCNKIPISIGRRDPTISKDSKISNIKILSNTLEISRNLSSFIDVYGAKTVYIRKNVLRGPRCSIPPIRFIRSKNTIIGENSCQPSDSSIPEAHRD